MHLASRVMEIPTRWEHGAHLKNNHGHTVSTIALKHGTVVSDYWKLKIKYESVTLQNE